MDDREAIERGVAVFEACYNGVIPTPAEVPSGSYGALNMKMIAETWGDERLSMREKRLIVISVLAASGADPSLFLIHARSALRNRELSAQDLRVMLNVVLYYAGVPKASTFYVELEKLLAETNQGETA